MIRVDFKKSLAKVIIPSGSTQPSALLQRDWVLPCKVVITSTHALPRHPRGFPMVEPLKLSTLKSQLKCTVNDVGASNNPRKLKRERKTRWPHKYPWNLVLGYTGLQRSDSNQYQHIGLLQNALKHQYSPSLDPTPNLRLGQRASTEKASHLQ